MDSKYNEDSLICYKVWSIVVNLRQKKNKQNGVARSAEII